MIVSKARCWTVLQVNAADFWFVGDLNARFCNPKIKASYTAPVTINTQPGCDPGAATKDCTQDPSLKGFGL